MVLVLLGVVAVDWARLSVWEQLGCSYLFWCGQHLLFQVQLYASEQLECSVIDEEQLLRNFYMVKRADWGRGLPAKYLVTSGLQG